MKSFFMKYKYFLLIVLIIIISVLAKYGYKKIYLKKILELKQQEQLLSAEKIPDSFWDKKYTNVVIKDKYKIAVVSHSGGEYSYSEFLKFAAER
jgi:hypothetical protein